jgi:hypothetical protein
MTTRPTVGSEVVRKGSSQRMKIIGLGEVAQRMHAWCEWIDKEGTPQSQQYPVDDLVLAVDHGPPGGPWAASRKGVT